MKKFASYDILEKLNETKYTEIYRVTHTFSSKKFILKILKSEFPSHELIVKIKNEFNILSQLNSSFVIKAYSLEKERNRYGILLEDIEGISLKEYFKGKLRLTEFFKISILMVNAIYEVHKKNIIHKDINPSNFIYNPNTESFKIIDFGISTNFLKQNAILENPNILEGTLNYISPEQTGRMNRSIDYRTDFYSLGVTFYEFLTGNLPFNFTDPMELVHSHIARKPIPLYEHDSSIPIPLSDLVLKLITKTAEERYLSSLGLKHDLEILQSGLSNYNQIFPKLGSKDISDKFNIPQKLYGRKKEIKILLSAFHRVVSEKSEMLLITGYSGIGKSSVVAEIYKPITEKRGYFVSGKFDQYNRNIPYKAFVNIFQDLIKQLLSETETQLYKWKEELLDALGDNAQVIIDVIPDLELILGKQPEAIILGANESQNRFNLVFQNFIKVFTKKEHPIVIFLDDLQWADSASLKLVHLLMASSSPGLLLIGAYRDNEVGNLHPLSVTLDEISKTGATLNYISLSPLTLPTVTQIIADTLSLTQDKIQTLAELVFSKTEGNPFFMNEFLKSLNSEGLLKFDDHNLTWTWEIKQIEERGFTDNVVELMTEKIKKLPEETETLLRLAACIGNHFDLKTLALVADKPLEEVERDILPAVLQSFLIFIGNIQDTDITNSLQENDKKIPEYKFAHDRIQQAAYFLIPEQQRAITHYQIGRFLERKMTSDLLEEKIFTIVNHLNYGISFITNLDEKKSLVVFNLLAARKARAATAYQATIEYTKIGLVLLGDNAWKEYYDICLELHDLAAEVAWLLGDLALMNVWINNVIENTKNPLDQIRAYFVKIQSLASQNKLQEAISTGLLILKNFGVTFPENPTPDDFVLGINEISSIVGERKIAELFFLPKMEDPVKLAVMNIAASLIPACYNAGSPLFPLIIIFQVKFSILNGNSPLSCFSYTSYGILLNNIMQDVPLCDEYRKLAYKLGMEPESKIMRAGTFTAIGLFLLHRSSHLRDTLTVLQTGYQIGLETGASEFSGYCGYGFCLNSFWCGETLLELESKILTYQENLRNINQLTAANYCSIFLEITQNLLYNEKENSDLDENPILAEVNISGDKTRLFYFYLHRMVSRFLLDEFNLALEDSEKVKQYLKAGAGTIAEIEFYFYYSLILIRKLSNLTTTANSDYPLESNLELSEIEKNQVQLQHWAKFAPMNHLHKWTLIEAEKSRLLGNRIEAEDLYDKTITLANQNGYIQEEALANELYSYYGLNRGKREFAQIYLRKARYAYSTWGANHKVALLDKKFPELISNVNDSDIMNSGRFLSRTTTEKTTRIEANLSLDFFSILKASQIISGEIILDKLLTSLMKVLVENAGAEKGFLLLEQKEKLFIEVSWDANSNQSDTSKYPLYEDNTLLSSSIVNYVNRTKQDLVLEDVTKDGKFKDTYILENKPKSVLAIPLLNQSKLVGIVYLENNLTTGAFTRDRIEVLKMLSSQAAISIENARLYSNLENITKEKTRVTTEMEIAKDIQTALLPKAPVLSGFEVATFMYTADLVGGDYYDIIHTQDREWFLIGDVSGHGVTAGLIMMMTQTAIHTILNSMETKNPSKLLSKVNQVITSNIKKMKLSKYMTLTLFLKESDGTIYYSGMHQDLLVYIAKEKKVNVIETKGSWLGYYDLHNEFEVDTIKMESGDVLLLFTDGITEATNQKEEMFEITGLIKILNESGQESAEKIKGRILTSLQNYKTDDDITFMICKRK